MLTKAGQKKLMRTWKDACESNKDPKSNVLYTLRNDDLKEWVFMIRSFPGIEELSNCYFIGSLSFPNEYPYKAPKIHMYTPTGRTKPDSNMCVSGLSSFHNDTWSATYTPQKIVYSFISTMYELGTSGIGWIPIKKKDFKSVCNETLREQLLNCNTDDDIVKLILTFFNAKAHDWNEHNITGLSHEFDNIIASQTTD
jgi:ubiquitin-protein ligase